MHGHCTSITKSRKVRCYAYKHDTINSHDVITSPRSLLCSTLTPKVLHLLLLLFPELLLHVSNLNQPNWFIDKD